jgi:hypothetical protein
LEITRGRGDGLWIMNMDRYYLGDHGKGVEKAYDLENHLGNGSQIKDYEPEKNYDHGDCLGIACMFMSVDIERL